MVLTKNFSKKISAVLSILLSTLLVLSALLIPAATADATTTVTQPSAPAAAQTFTRGSTVTGTLRAKVVPVTPTLLTIPKIGVNAAVKSMGITSDGKMAVPDNYTDVGWFAAAGTTIPGNIGNAVLGAHVDSGGTKKTTSGVFKNLDKLVAGDTIDITDKNGNVFHFKVASTKIYAYNSTTTAEVFGHADASHLNLITCHGVWLPKAGTYNERLVVFAVRI
jgi:sortase A